MGLRASDLHLLCRKVGKVLEEYRTKKNLSVQDKGDGSPVSEADLEAHERLVHGLKYLDPRIPILSEETWDRSDQTFADESDYWMIDPLDGTKDFLVGKEDYTINLVRIRKKELYMGCIYHPPTDAFYFAQRNVGAFRQLFDGDWQRMSARFWPDGDPHVLLSRSHVTFEDELVKKVWPKARITGMASALKFCKIAEGYADLYFRNTPTMEWDTAAGQLICEEAGGLVIDWQCEKLTYHKNNRKNSGFIAIANRAHLKEVYDVLVKNKSW